MPSARNYSGTDTGFERSRATLLRFTFARRFTVPENRLLPVVHVP